MPTTAGSTTRGFPYPGDATAPPDGPAAFKALADATEAEFNDSAAALAAAIAAAAALTPAGVMYPYAGTAAPAGFLLCDGSAVSRSTYAALFAVVGTAFGAGNGSTTFNLPDARGRPLYGVGTHAALNALGENDGITVVADRRAAHVHSVNAHSHSFSATTGTASAAMAPTPLVADQALATAGHTHSVSGNTGSSGTATGESNVPFLAVNYIVKF